MRPETQILPANLYLPSKEHPRQTDVRHAVCLVQICADGVTAFGKAFTHVPDNQPSLFSAVSRPL